MPEITECKLMAERLNDFIGGTTITITLLSSTYREDSGSKWAKMRKEFATLPRRLKLRRVYNHGKFIIFDCAGNVVILNWLAMTGYWRLNKGPNTHLKIASSNGKVVYYDDIRHFGGFEVLTPEELSAKLRHFGPDAWRITFAKFQERIALPKNQKKPIANVLMDQTVLAGMGNYLRSEVLYAARIDPRRKVRSLTASELRALYTGMKKVFAESYKEHGTKLHTYKDLAARGDIVPGKYKPAVYGQRTDPKGNPIKTFQLGGRTMWWCPAVQKN